MSDWEYSDESCPKCGEQMAWRRCNEIGCGDDLEDDGFPAGVCDACDGEGYQEWCRECGWDNVEQMFLTAEYEAQHNARVMADYDRQRRFLMSGMADRLLDNLKRNEKNKTDSQTD